MATQIRTMSDSGFEVAYNFLGIEDAKENYFFVNEGRFAGWLCALGTMYDPRVAFEHTFPCGTIIRSPGIVDEQQCTMSIHGVPTPVVIDHSREVAVTFFSVRPIVEVELPTGHFSHFAFRPNGAFTSGWVRVTPLSESLPYGNLGRQFERFCWVIQVLVGSILVVGWIAYALG